MASVLFQASGASADVSTEVSARAEKLFEAGRKLIDAGEIDLACKSFKASLDIDPELGTMLNLADCRERQGRLVEAHQLFSAAVEEATRANKPGRRDFARQRLDALAGKLVEIKLVVAERTLPRLVVKVDGRAVSPELWNTPIVRQPSTIVVDAAAPGRKPFHAEVVGSSGARVAIDVPALAPLPEMANAGAVIEARSVAGAPSRVDVTSRVGGGTRRAGSRTALVVGGAGGALAFGGLVLGLHARTRYHDELSAGLPDLNARLDGPQREADVATAIGVAGAVALGVGVVLYVRGRRDRVVIAPTATTVSAGLTVMGAL